MAGEISDNQGNRPLPRNVKLLGAASLLNDVASEIIFPLMPQFLITVLTEPAEKTLVATLVGAERKGLAFGWFNFAIGIAALPSSLIFGWLYEQHGPLVAFGWGAGLSALAAILLLFVSTKPVDSLDEERDHIAKWAAPNANLSIPRFCL
ncbi:MAG: hypothetical protein WKF77_10305 [Planctomycetaceae bacterium]